MVRLLVPPPSLRLSLFLRAWLGNSRWPQPGYQPLDRNEATINLAETTTIITGGAGGIGLAVGIAIINVGGRVAVLDTDENAAHAAAARLASSGGATAGFGADVTDPYSLARAFAAAGKALGPIDELVTCAGIRQTSAPVHSLPHDEWTQVLKVDLFGTFLSCQIAAKMMLEQGSGSIVTIGSTSATLPRLGQAAYCTAKAGVAAFTRVLALELAEGGVRANCVNSGSTSTGMVNLWEL